MADTEKPEAFRKSKFAYTHVILDQAVSSTSEETTPADPPPDGGLVAWLQVVACFFMLFNPWGLVNSFGTFQTYYNGTLGRSPSDIAWIGTFQGFLIFFGSGFVGAIYDKGYVRQLIIFGTFFMTLGLMMTSISTRYYQVFLAQGVCTGLGSGALTVPGLAIIAQYFSRKRALATGIIAAGGSLGAILYPIIFSQLEPRISFGWATRVIAFITLGTLTLSLVLVRPRPQRLKKSRAIFDTAALKNREFIVVSISQLLFLLGVYMPFFYISIWAQTTLGTDDSTSFYLLSILNAGSLVGRISPGPVADRIGSITMMAPLTLISGILIFAWISVDALPTAILFCVFYGLFSGALLSLPATAMANIAPDLGRIGTWIGMSFGIASVGLLIGNPISGALISSEGGGFLGAQCFGGATVLAGGCGLCYVRYLMYKRGLTWGMKA